MAYLDESWLDDAGHLQRCDSQDSLRALATAGAQVREAMVLAEEGRIAQVCGGERPRTVLVAALGGSEIVGAVLETLAQQASPVPVLMRHDVPLPGWVGPLDLVIAVSLSGRAPGPLALATEAARRGAYLLTVGADGSPLADVCAQARGVHIGIGRGRATSRAALWSLLTPALMGLDALGIIEAGPDDLREAAAALDREAEVARPSSEHFVNPAKLAALQLAGTVPMALASGPLMAPVARRAASMFARTARVPMTWGELPDDASDVVATLDGPFTAGAGDGVGSAADDIFADPFLDAPRTPGLGLLTLHEHPAGQDDVLGSVADGVQGMATQAGATVVDLHPEPGPPLARMAGLMARVDFTATYLALGQGLDPSVSRHVTSLRDHLAQYRR